MADVLAVQVRLLECAKKKGYFIYLLFPQPRSFAEMKPSLGSLAVTACGNAHCNKAISCMQMSCLHVPAPVIVT